MIVLLVIAAVPIALAVWLAQRDSLGWALRRAADLILWILVGVVALSVSIGLIAGVRGATGVSRLLSVAVGVLAFAVWYGRALAAQRWPERVVRIDRIVFLSAFAVYTAIAVSWLVLGLLPALAATVPDIDRQFRAWGRGDGLVAALALNASRAGRNASSAPQVAFDYLFSTLNLALGVFLALKVRRNRTAGLLAFGMVGTAVAFNLQSHAVFQVLAGRLTEFTRYWHDLGVHVLAGVCYVVALLLFPDGRLTGRSGFRGPLLLALVFGLVSFVAIADHTTALVVLFGVLIPVAALGSQTRRLRGATSPEVAQQSRLLLLAMGASLAAAVVVVAVTHVLASRDEHFSQTTREYEFVTPGPGRYYFYCDPHIDTMKGIVDVRPASAGELPASIAMRARSGRFTTGAIRLPAHQTVVIRFTNEDGDAHNVAIYRDPFRHDPVFVGETFSGQDLATFTFRVFRAVFALIPIALFVGILRFHLWDVDRLVNRAMVYAALTGVLAMAYATLALVTGLLPERLFHTSELVVVWVVAAAFLFRPLRRRVQSAIDKRFYRQKYDAARTLDLFSRSLRDEIDLDRLAEELVSVVSDTMQPAQVSLWLRDADAPHD